MKKFMTQALEKIKPFAPLIVLLVVGITAIIAGFSMFYVWYALTHGLPENEFSMNLLVIATNITGISFVLIFLLIVIISIAALIASIYQVATKQMKVSAFVDGLMITAVFIVGILACLLYEGAMEADKEFIISYMRKYGLLRFTIAQFTGEISREIATVVWSVTVLAVIMLKQCVAEVLRRKRAA